MHRTITIGVRLSPDELAKLDALAQKTLRDRSKVVRLLLAQALVRESPDIQLKGTGAAHA